MWNSAKLLWRAFLEYGAALVFLSVEDVLMGSGVGTLHFEKRDTRDAAKACFRELYCGPDGRLLVSRSVALRSLVSICVQCDDHTSQVPRRCHVEMALSILDDLEDERGLNSASHWGMHPA